MLEEMSDLFGFDMFSCINSCDFCYPEIVEQDPSCSVGLVNQLFGCHTRSCSACNLARLQFSCCRCTAATYGHDVPHSACMNEGIALLKPTLDALGLTKEVLAIFFLTHPQSMVSYFRLDKLVIVS